MSIEEMFGLVMSNLSWLNIVTGMIFVANGVTIYQMCKKLDELKAIIENLNSKIVRKL